MLKQHWRFISNVERVADNCIVVLAFILAYYAREPVLTTLARFFSNIPPEPQALAPIESYLIVLGIALPLYNGALSVLGGYRSMRFSSLLGLTRVVFFASVIVFLSEGALLYLLKWDLSRSFIGIFCALCALLLLFERYLVLWILRYWRSRGLNYRNILLVGTDEQSRRIFEEVSKRPELGIRVVGFATFETDSRLELLGQGNGLDGTLRQPGGKPSAPLPAPVIASPETFEVALKRYAVDEVLFTDVVRYFALVEELARIASEEGVRVTLAANWFSLEIFKSDVSYFGAVPLIHYQPSPADGATLYLKRAIDISVSASLLLVLSPLLLSVPFLIALESHGPVFFRQRRIGLNGRQFTLLKFRSMVRDAEKLLPALRSQNEMQGPVFKLKADPRITRVGKWLRRFSIDELPQLINVLRGDMSLVGPRPPLPEEVSLYVRKHRRRLSMRPGLTCTWQVSGRNENPDFERWMELDLEYVDNWSLRNDLRLLVKTIPAVLLGSGAR